jgi:hypothetical protein
MSRFGFAVLLVVAQVAAPHLGRAQSEDDIGTRSRQVQQLYEAGKFSPAGQREN